jgi:hypothetical protein
MEDRVYLVPGQGNRLHELGDAIIGLGFEVMGRELVPPFSGLRFSEQLDVIKSDLQTYCWHPETNLVGHSYGGYLLLHALTELDPFPGEMLLFSPVLGTAFSKDRFFFSRPPRGEVLLKLAESGAFPSPRRLCIHTGENDVGCDPALALKIGSLAANVRVTIVKNQGHRLSEEVVHDALTQFLHR